MEGNYIIAESKCDGKGSGGVLLVVSAKLPFAHVIPGCDLPMTVAEPDVSILGARPQVLIVRISAPRYQAMIMVIHGPDASYKVEYCSEFWDAAFEDFQKCFAVDENVVFLFDGNCRIAGREGPDDEYIGPVLDPANRHTYVEDSVVCFSARPDQ